MTDFAEPSLPEEGESPKQLMNVNVTFIKLILVNGDKLDLPVRKISKTNDGGAYIFELHPFVEKQMVIMEPVRLEHIAFLAAYNEVVQQEVELTNEGQPESNIATMANPINLSEEQDSSV